MSDLCCDVCHCICLMCSSPVEAEAVGQAPVEHGLREEQPHLVNIHTYIYIYIEKERETERDIVYIYICICVYVCMCICVDV